ncbi:MAG: hypothetical protein U1E65_27360 [Myxococcota bacterium]
MSINGVQHLNQAHYKNALEAQRGSLEDADHATKSHQEAVDRSYQHELVRIQKESDARGTGGFFKGLGALLGTWMVPIPYIGSVMGGFLGASVGQLANGGDREAARNEKRAVQIADLEVSRAFDRFDKARNELDDHANDTAAVEKFGRELRDMSTANLDPT